ncbi:unnamed protein product [Prorocentrum cordatum]|uniref:Uncharacterized protein n=1 Tax=Prorocentrum cordatum TaxID=2364126 RepID=A0ABN9XAS7_9DINO|nr:unnamed protein product [Polarella glacialis]
MAPSAAGGEPGARAARRDKWLYKTCLGPDHKPYVNFSDKLCCNNCGLAKSVVHGGPVKATSPSKPAPWAQGGAQGKITGSISAQLLEMQKQARSLTAELKLAKARAPSASAPTTDAEKGGDEPGAESAAKRRLDELDSLLKQLAGVDAPEVAKLVDQCRQEQTKLRAQLFMEKPPSQRIKTLGFKITKVEQQVTKQQHARESKQAQLEALQAEIAKQDAALAGSRKQLLELEGQRVQLLGAMPQPPTQPPGAAAGQDESSWTLPKLEQVLLAAGAAPDLQHEVVAIVGKLRQHRLDQHQQAQTQREADDRRAAEPTEQQQDEAMGEAAEEAQEEESVNQASAEELRDSLRESGADFPGAADASGEELRAAVKRILLAKPKWKVVKKLRTI